MNQKLSIQDETRLKEISEYLFKRSHPRSSLVDVLKKWGMDKEEYIKTCKALSILEGGKMIKTTIDKEHPYLSEIQLLDDKGQEIPSESCDTFENSDTFGCWIKEYRTDKKITCFKHLEESLNQKVPMIKDCDKCLASWANSRCLAHNQSIVFCAKCHEHSKKLRSLICEDFTFDQCVDLLMNEHKKDLIKRRGF